MEPQLQRVSVRLASLILDFCKNNVGAYNHFYMEALRSYIFRHGVTCAPASPDRILRDLRRRGQVNYKVVRRDKSLYQVIPFPSSPTPAVQLPLAA